MQCFQSTFFMYKLSPLSSAERGQRDLSEEEHYPGDGHDDHNSEYDHDAFLGKEEAERFDQLPPEEAKRRLG